MKSNFLIYILILLSFSILAVGGFMLVRFFSSVGMFIFAFLGISWMLFVTGLMGPKSLRTKIRESQVWFRTKAVIFLPIHPYLPIDEALKSGVKEFLPTPKRIVNWFIVKIVWFIISILIIYFIFRLSK